MNYRQQGKGRGYSRGFFTLILLIILIIVFHLELMIYGLRLIDTIFPNADTERLIATYYVKAAKKNVQKANKYYALSVKKYITQLVNEQNAADKAKLNLILSRFYECERGKPYDLDKAKSHLEEAKKLADKSKDPELVKMVQESIDRVEGEMKSPGMKPTCEDYVGLPYYFSTYEWMDRFIQKDSNYDLLNQNEKEQDKGDEKGHERDQDIEDKDNENDRDRSKDKDKDKEKNNSYQTTTGEEKKSTDNKGSE